MNKQILARLAFVAAMKEVQKEVGANPFDPFLPPDEIDIYTDDFDCLGDDVLRVLEALEKIL